MSLCRYKQISTFYLSPSKLNSILFPQRPSTASLHLCSYLRMLPREEAGLSNIYDDSIIIAFIILSSSLCVLVSQVFPTYIQPCPTCQEAPANICGAISSRPPQGGPKLLTAQLVWICPPSQQQEPRSKAFAVAGKPHWQGGGGELDPPLSTIHQQNYRLS